MKKPLFRFITFTVAAWIFAAAQVQAVLLTNEDFSYPDGALTNVSGGAWVAYSGVSALNVSNGQAIVTDASTQDAGLAIGGGAHSNDILYAGFDVAVTALPRTNASYFLHFKDSSVINFIARVEATNDAGQVRFGIANYAPAFTNPGVAYWPTTVSTSTWHRIIVEVNQTGTVAVSTLWLDAVAPSDPHITASDAPGVFTNADIAAIALRQSLTNLGAGTELVDNLLVGTTFADVAGSVANSWIDGNSKWETGTNWSLSTPPFSNQMVFVTNAITKTVTIDLATTTNAGGSTMTISNLTVSGPVNSTNTLSLNNAGTTTPLHILNAATINTGGALLITNSAFQVDGLGGGDFRVDGGATLANGSSIIASNVGTVIGNAGSGSLTVFGGSMTISLLRVGNVAGSRGTVTASGGTITSIAPFDGIELGKLAGSTGTLWLTGGRLVVTNNAATVLGDAGVGQMAVSNGTALLTAMYVGFNTGSAGTLTIAGGTNQLSSLLYLGRFNSATGSVWMTGGRLVVTNAEVDVGQDGVGQMTVSNGTVLLREQSVGFSAGSVGTLTIAGGTSAMIGPLNVGGAAGSTGTLWVAGGQLVVTNTPASVGAGNGFVVDGSVTLTNNSSIIVSNASTVIGNVGGGSLTNLGGSLSLSNLLVGNFSGSRGTLTVAGGTNRLSILTIGASPGATGAVWITGGQLIMPANGQVKVGNGGAGQMTVSNGALSLFALNVAVTNGSAGTVTITGGSVTSSNQLGIGFPSTTGTVWMTGGVLTSPIHQILIGNGGRGQMIVSNGSVIYPTVEAGTVPNSAGTLTVAGGIHSIDFLNVGRNSGATGVVWLTGGVLTNQQAVIGDFQSRGQLTVSNGTLLSDGVSVGADAGSQGTLTAAGGTSTFSSLDVAALPNATGTVWVTGGQLTVTNSIARVGELGIGQMTVSNGTTILRNVQVGSFGGSSGALTVAGGNNSVYSNLAVGLPNCSSVGFIIVAGGNLNVTNAAGNAVLKIDSGTLTLNSGTLRADTFIMTNACGHFTRTGGTFIYSSAVLNPALDADGDGLPNGWEQTYGIDPLSSTGVNGAAGDFDGDGFSNLQEYNLGTNPNNSSSVPVNSWTNSVSGKWETAGNWSLGLAPTNNQTLAVTNALSKTVTIDTTTSSSFPSTMTISNLTMAGAGSSTNTLSVNNGGAFPFHVRDQLILSNNSVVVINNASEFDVDGSLSVGSSGTGNQLIITNGGVVWDLGTAVIGGLPGSNNSVVVTDSGIWEVDGALVVRNSGPGTAIKIAEGGIVFALTNVFIGNSASADGNIVLVTDPGSYWENDGALSIGGTSQGNQFIVSNGAQAVSANVTIGNPVGANHSATITGTGSIWQVATTIQVGNGGTNDSLTISDAGSLSATQIKVNGAILVLNGGTFTTPSLIVTNGGAVQYAQTYRVDNSTVSVASGTVAANSNLLVASSGGSTGTVNVTGGQLVVTNGALSIGNDGTITSGGGVGLMTVSNATLLSSTNLIGSSAGGKGDLILAAGGQIVCPTGTNCLMLINSLGFDQIGGTLTWVGSTLEVGVSAAGDYNVSGGQATFDDLYAGYGNVGTMTMIGGSAEVRSRLIIGHLGSPVSTGVVWITGGQLSIPNDYTLIGNSGVGRMAISNGVVTASDVIVGNSSNPGTLTLAGGTLTLNSLVLPNPASRFVFSGGCLNAKGVTNANGQICILGDAVTSATLSLLGGITLLDNGFKVATNATLSGLGTVNGSILNYGLISPSGLLIVNGVVTNNGVIVAPDGSSIDFNGQLVNNGMIVTNSSIHFNGGIVNNGRLMDAAADNDGDGMNNMWEAMAGTILTNSTSVLRVVTAAIEGNGVRVTWKAVGGRHYVVQAGTGGTAGSYSNNFTDISSVISAFGIGESTTNYLDVSGALGGGCRYYRVRIAP